MKKAIDLMQATGAAPMPAPRWRDAPENMALARKAVESGAFDQKTVNDTLDYHEKNGSDPGPVLRHAIYSHGLGTKPYLDTTGMKNELADFESRIVDEMLGGKIRTEKIV